MTRIGKRILSAFVDVGEDPPASTSAVETAAAADISTTTAPGAMTASGATTASGAVTASGATTVNAATEQRFAAYFDKLFGDANIPGPDYYEFARMIGAMQMIADDRARYAAAFAGLQVQGLDKEKLLTTANEYLRVLSTDADQFRKTVDTALQEKVHRRNAEAEEKSRRIQALSQEILDLQQQIGALKQEIAESREKLDVSSNGYAAESDRRRQQVLVDIERIKQYL
jgi:hypothetical protein